MCRSLVLLIALTTALTLPFKTDAQCDTGSEPECECESAEILCSINELDGYSFSMSDFQHPQDGPDPLCGGSWVPNNPTWFAFIAWCDELTLTVSISNCTMIPNFPTPSFGAQVGVYSDCNSFNEVECIGNDCNNEDDKELELEGLIIGQVYYFMIDGCLGSACDVEISVDGNCTEEIEDWTDPTINGDTEVCAGDNVEYDVEQLSGAAFYHWYIDGSEVDVPDDPENSFIWTGEGSYELCVDVSNECLDESEDPEQICETINVYGPDAGMLTATPNPLCPGETSDVEVLGYNDGADYTQVLIVVDDNGEVLDVITGSDVTSVSLDECGTITVYSLNFPTAENIPVPSIGESYSGSDCSEDCCDETSEDIIFEDDEEPTFDAMPPDLTLACYADVPPLMDLTATDNCTPDASVSAMETDDSEMCDGGTIVREWEFEDDCGNTVSHTQTIIIEPIPEPDYISPPGDEVIDCTDPVPPAVDLDYSNNGSGACLIEGTITPSVTGSFDPCGSMISYEWDYTDMCGNNINHVQSIEIIPADPVDFISPPADVVLDCEETIPPAIDLDYTNGSSGACLYEGSVSPTVNGSFDPCGSEITYTWEYTDPCGNQIEHEQLIDIRPADEAIYLNPPSDITLDCDDYTSFTAMDLMYSNGSSGSCLIEGSSSPVVDEDLDGCGGSVEISYSYTDDCGREIEHIFTITVNPPPMADFVSMPADITVDCNSIPPPADPLDYTNNESGICLIEGTEDPDIDEDYDACGGTIINTWAFEDDCGRSIEHVQTITVNPAPMAMFTSFPLDMNLDCEEFDDFSPVEIDYTNNLSGACLIEGSIEPEALGAIDECGGVIEYLWEFEDDCGRIIEHSQIISVTPAEAPQFINVPSDITLDCEDVNDDLPFLEYDNEQSGICQIQGFVEAVPNGSINECGGVIEMIWTFTDNCNRQITESQMIEYLPAPEPEFEDLPEDMLIDCDEDLPDPDPLFFDNGEDSPCEISGEVDPIVDFDDNIYTYFWTYTNPCSGATIEHTQTLEKLIPVELDEDEFEFEICIGNSFDLEELIVNDLNNTDPEFSYHDDLPPDSGNEIDPEIILEDDYMEFYIVGTNEYGCLDFATVFFFADDPVSAGEDIEEEFCAGIELLDLYAFLEPPASLDGEFTQTDGPSDLDFSFGDEVDVSDALPGIYTFDYYVESESSCPDDDAVMIIELIAQPEIELVSIECAPDGNSYEVIITNDDYEIEISDGIITSETETEVVIDQIPVGINLTIELEDSGSDCINSYTFNSPDCACPAVPTFAFPGDTLICAGDEVPVLEVQAIPDVIANWYDSPTGGTLLSADSYSYQPNASMPGTYSFYVESESAIQGGCFGPFRIEIVLTIVANPVSMDTSILVCDESYTGFSTFEKQDLDILLNPLQNNWSISYFSSVDDLENSVNELTFPYTNTTAFQQLIYASLENGSGCSSVYTVELNVNPSPQLEIDIFNETCTNQEDGILNVSVTSSSVSYILELNGTESDELQFENLSPGVYNLIVTDSLGCTASEDVEIMPGASLEIVEWEAICSDNGTESDPSDDFYEIVFLVSSTDMAVAEFSLDDNLGNNYGPFPVDAQHTIQLAASSVNVSLVASESVNGCSDTIDIGLLTPCSTNCLLSSDLFESQCNNNGTASDASDDFYEFTIEVSVLNGGPSQTFSIFNNGMLLHEDIDYNTAFDFILEADGTMTSLQFQDTDDPSCALALPAVALTGCSDECALMVDLIGSICNNNDTEQIEVDDYYTISVFANGFNTSDSVLINGGPAAFAYGDTIDIDSLFVISMDTMLVFTDQLDPSCSDTLTIQQQNPCSEPCFIEVQNLVVSNCSDNGTANDETDDTYDISFTVVHLEGNMSAVQISDNQGNLYGPFNYGEDIILTGIPASDNPLVLDISDNQYSNCAESLSIDIPPCSEPCSIDATLVSVLCIDNGTLETNDDDLYTATIEVTATGGSPGGFDTDLGPSGNYGDEIVIDNQNISDGNIILNISDTGYSDCMTEITVQAPPPCSEPCTMVFDALEVFNCDDNGTPTDPSDDFFFVQFAVSVTNGNFSVYFIEDSDGNISGPFAYGQPIDFGPFQANGEETVLFFTDENNSTCALETSVRQNSCSDLCQLEAEIIAINCNDNGTAETNEDDSFSVEFIVTGVNNSSEYTVSNVGSSFNYNDTITLDGFLISNGILELEIIDGNDPSCTLNLPVTPPEPCSSPCEVNLVDFSQTDCDDNGTGPTGDDDFYTINFIIENTEGGSGSYFLNAGTEQYGPFTYGLSAEIGPLPSDGNPISFTLVDTGNAVCQLTFESISQPCSSCDRNVEIVNDENVLNCEVSSIVLDIDNTSEITSINWSGPEGFSETTESVEVSMEGSYSLTVEFEDGCTATDEVVINAEFEAPEAIAPEGGTLNCMTNSIQLDPGNSLLTDNSIISWIDASGSVVSEEPILDITNAGNYQLVLTDTVSMCMDTSTMIVVDENYSTPSIIVYTEPGNIFDCVVETIILSTETEENTSYTWIIDNEIVSTDPSIEVNQASEVLLIALDTISLCEDSEMVDLLDFTEYPVINLSDIPDVNCDNEEVCIELSTSSLGQELMVEWLNANNEVVLQDAYTFCTLLPGQYTAQVTDISNNCSNTETFALEAPLIPSVVLQTEIVLGIGDNYQLNPVIDLPLNQIDSIIWDSDALLDCYDCLTPSIISYEDGDEIFLSVISTTGCEGMAETRIRIEQTDEPSVYIPNIFAPSRTVNFTIYASEEIETIDEMYIYDRWGELVYSNTSFPPNIPDHGWDGTFNDRRVEQGVYVYLFVFDLNGRKEYRYGDITILW